MKDISIFMLHPGVTSVEKMLKGLCLESLKKEYNFIWNEQSPDYLIVTEHVYINAVYAKKMRELYQKGKRVTIFWPGECIAPDLNMFDYAVTFTGNMTVGDRVVQMPPCKEFFASFLTNDAPVSSLKEAEQLLKQKKAFCNFLYSNSYAHPMRDRLFYKISEYKQVDSLGRHLNNVKNQGTGYMGHWKDATELKRNYKFSIACENAVFDGYTSEKMITSLQAHTIPIYFGDPSINDNFNPKAFINVADFSTLDECLEEIKKIDTSDELWMEKMCEPWWTQDQLENNALRMCTYIQFFRNIFAGYGGGGNAESRRERGLINISNTFLTESVKILPLPKGQLIKCKEPVIK